MRSQHVGCERPRERVHLLGRGDHHALHVRPETQRVLERVQPLEHRELGIAPGVAEDSLQAGGRGLPIGSRGGLHETIFSIRRVLRSGAWGAG